MMEFAVKPDYAGLASYLKDRREFMAQFFECLFIEAMYADYRRWRSRRTGSEVLTRQTFIPALNNRLDAELEHRPLIKVAQN